MCVCFFFFLLLRLESCYFLNIVRNLCIFCSLSFNYLFSAHYLYVSFCKNFILHSFLLSLYSLFYSVLIISFSFLFTFSVYLLQTLLFSTSFFYFYLFIYLFILFKRKHFTFNFEEFLSFYLLHAFTFPFILQIFSLNHCLIHCIFFTLPYSYYIIPFYSTNFSHHIVRNIYIYPLYQQPNLPFLYFSIPYLSIPSTRPSFPRSYPSYSPTLQLSSNLYGPLRNFTYTISHFLRQ